MAYNLQSTILLHNNINHYNINIRRKQSKKITERQINKKSQKHKSIKNQ